jgi:hypothetical protein
VHSRARPTANFHTRCSSSSLSLSSWVAKFGVQKLVWNSIIALFSQAKQSIIGARFSSTNFTFFRRKGLLIRLNRKPATTFQPHPPPVTTDSFYFNKCQWWLAVHSRARPTANFHTRCSSSSLSLSSWVAKFGVQKLVWNSIIN